MSSWSMGVTFSGKQSGLSVKSFLEKIETYRVARNFPENELRNSLIDILQGDA